MRKFLIVLISLLIVLGVLGCESNKLKRVVESDSPKNAINAFFSEFKKCNFEKAESFILNKQLLNMDIDIYDELTPGEKRIIKYWNEKIGYKILSSNIKGYKASVNAEIMALNGEKIYKRYISDITKLKKDLSIQENKSKFNREYDKALIKEVRNKNNEIVTNSVTINLRNRDGNWYIEGDENLFRALCGGLSLDKINNF
ncbi:hypothetical protein BH724_01000 [Clostridium baratii]|uniref:hypothetical protein n=1 Tax=Clostridium baratii TaxID=1561 RepID=UPI0009A3B519|nr:hypothetical protein [Clostridium baratii]OPF58750.1 hypothetical protein BH724_01000 [Clostridium baratii]